eukprot:gene12385-biopygen6442
MGEISCGKVSRGDPIFLCSAPLPSARPHARAALPAPTSLNTGPRDHATSRGAVHTHSQRRQQNVRSQHLPARARERLRLLAPGRRVTPPPLGSQDTGAGGARAWRGRGAGYRQFLAWVARARPAPRPRHPSQGMPVARATPALPSCSPRV